jgi:putative aldouronate transport system substrate-binding protein
MKKKATKKLMATAVAAAMTVSMLTGCASAGTNASTAASSSTGSSSTSSESSDTGTASSGEKTKISIYRCTYNLASPDSAQVKKVQDAINEYIADKINVEIVINDLPSGEYKDKANLALANNEINLLWTASWWETIGTDDLYRQNGAYDITDLLPGTTLYDSMSEGIWEASKYDGKVYFIPVYKESYEGYDLKTRQDLVDQYGWDVSTVKELKDIEPFLADLKADGIKYPYVTGKTAMFYRYYLDKYDFFSNYSYLAVDRATDTVVDPILTDDYLEFCTLMCDWAEKGYISEDDVTKVTADNVAQTKDWGWGWWTCVPGDEANSEARDMQDEVIIEGITNKYAHSTTTLGSCFAITSNSTEEQAKACIDFLGLLYTDTTVADLYTYGIEGEDYTINSDGRVEQNSDKYNHSAWESTSVVPLTLLKDDAEDKVQQYVDNNNAAETSCAAGFRFDKSNVEAQYTACANVFDQYGFVLENGGYAAKDVESVIQQFQAALDEAGYQDVLAEASAQYEAWKAAK